VARAVSGQSFSTHVAISGWPTRKDRGLHEMPAKRGLDHHREIALALPLRNLAPVPLGAMSGRRMVTIVGKDRPSAPENVRAGRGSPQLAGKAGVGTT
jgi:hypothetical protein